MATSTAKDPSQDEEFLSQLYKGGELLAAGKVVEAKDHLERAFKLHPKNEKAQNLLGLTYFKLGLFDRAAEIYELLVRENPADPTLRVNLGLVYLKTNNLPRAVKEFETSTDLEPTHKKAHNYLGLALAQSGDYAKAQEHFVVAGSDAMAEKMGRAIAAGATAPVTVSTAPPPSAPPPPPTPPPAESEAYSHAQPSVVPLPGPSEASQQRMVLPRESTSSKTLQAFAAPPVPSFDTLVMPETPASEVLEVTSDSDVAADDEVIPAEQLLKPKGSPPGAAAQFAQAARSMGGGAKAPLPQAGFEDVPPPSPSSPVGKAMRNDWGAQFGMDEPSAGAAEEAPPPRPSGDDMRFAEDEGPPSMPMPDSDGAVATSEAAVATGAQVPLESVTSVSDSAAWADSQELPEMPVVESTAEEMMVEIDVPITAPTAARQSDMALSDAAEQAEAPPAYEETPSQPYDEEPQPYEETPSQPYDDSPSQAPDMPPGLSFTGTPPTVDVPVEDASAPAVEEGQQTPDVEMFPQENDPYATQEAWPEESASAPPAEDPDWLTQQQAAASSEEQPAPEMATGELPAQSDDAYATGDYAAADDADYSAGGGFEASQGPSSSSSLEDELAGEPAGGAPSIATEVPLTEEIPTAAKDMEVSQVTAPSGGYSPMTAPKLEELGPSSSMAFTPGEMTGPFNLSPEGLALSVTGELLTRMPGLLAVAGSVDATPENKRSRGRATELPFGQGVQQLQRVRGNGVIHLEPGDSTYQAIDLADEGAYVREERVFAFEEAVAFENARLTGTGNIAVDIVHLKGQGKVLLKLEGALKAMAIPPGTPLKVPLARLVGWYGYVSVRVMGFVGQGAVELTGDGYVLLAT